MEILIHNLTNPALLFFVLGVISKQLKGDLEIPKSSSKFISLYLLFSIGFKGGQELSHSSISLDIAGALLFGIILALLIPIYTFFILKPKLGTENAGAVAASYGSISAVTFISSIYFLESENIQFSGHMVAVMATMEAPSIAVGVILLGMYRNGNVKRPSFGKILHHSLTNGSVLLIIGSLIIGIMANEEQAAGIKPFTTDIFTGFLAIFLLDMGLICGEKLKSLFKEGWFVVGFSLIMPLINGTWVAFASRLVTDNTSDQFLFAILGASASYIAVPAAMKIIAPKANPGIYIPMALAITFPLNISIGIPYYYWLCHL